ncbi:MAG TPA: tetratricopeptide repeat protein, partial [Chloroflexota bacterium]|nr:tetratricopeptide repeat protein [Chloroflexota bacterium]
QTDVGIAYMNLGRFDAAEPVFQDLLRKQPASAQVHYSLGFLYSRAAVPDPQAAARHWQEAARLQPDTQWATAALQELNQSRSGVTTP